jgi:hypothetical protein
MGKAFAARCRADHNCAGSLGKEIRRLAEATTPADAAARISGLGYIALSAPNSFGFPVGDYVSNYTSRQGELVVGSRRGSGAAGKGPSWPQARRVSTAASWPPRGLLTRPLRPHAALARWPRPLACPDVLDAMYAGVYVPLWSGPTVTTTYRGQKRYDGAFRTPLPVCVGLLACAPCRRLRAPTWSGPRPARLAHASAPLRRVSHSALPSPSPPPPPPPPPPPAPVPPGQHHLLHQGLGAADRLEV